MKRILPYVVISTSFLFISRPSPARDLSVYESFLSAGNALTTGTANSMMVLDDGVLSLWSNPAGIVNPRHEIYAGGTLQGAFSVQSHVTPAPWNGNIGMLAYCYSFTSSAFALAYVPRNVMEVSADFNRVGEIRNLMTYGEITATYATDLGRGYSVGLSAGPILGSARDGALTDAADMDTLYHPLLWFARIGIKQKQGITRWGVTVEAPATGRFTRERPVNVGYQRDKVEVEYSGALGVRAGAGWDLKFMGLEADVLYYNTQMVKVEGESAGLDQPVISAGAAVSLQASDQIRLRGGLRIRFESPDDQHFIQAGAGVSYLLSPDLDLVASGGLMLPYGSGVRGTVFNDLRPFTLRAGVIYHNMP